MPKTKRKRGLAPRVSPTRMSVLAAYDFVRGVCIPPIENAELSAALQGWVNDAVFAAGETKRLLATELAEAQENYEAAGIQFVYEHRNPAGPLLIDPNLKVELPKDLGDFSASEAVLESVTVESRQDEARRAKEFLREAILSFVRQCRAARQNPLGCWPSGDTESNSRVFVSFLPQLCYRRPVTRRSNAPHPEKPQQQTQDASDLIGSAEHATLPVRPIDLSDFATIHVAAKELGIDKESLHRAIDSGWITVHELLGGTKVVSLSQCRTEWPDGANPVGRSPKRETHDTSSPRLPGHASLETLSSIAEQRLTAELGEFDAKLPASLESRLRRIEQALVELHQPIRHVLHDFIRDINAVPEAERKMSSLDANKRLASTLQRMLTTVGERLCCPSCDSPGTFRCKEGNTKNGVFEFSHSVGESKEGKRSCGGWGSIPILTLVKKS